MKVNWVNLLNARRSMYATQVEQHCPTDLSCPAVHDARYWLRNCRVLVSSCPSIASLTARDEGGAHTTSMRVPDGLQANAVSSHGEHSCSLTCQQVAHQACFFSRTQGPDLILLATVRKDNLRRW
jgi:hypothetical protein